MLYPLKNILVLSPHPDDELGCSGAIAKFIEMGASVHHWFFSFCTPSMEKLSLTPDDLLKECTDSRNVLKIPKENCGNFDFPVREFPAYRQEILEALIKLKQEIKPDLVFMPSSCDIHQDHQCIYEEGLRAFKDSNILGYELPWNMLSSKNNCFFKLTQQQLQIKLDVLSCYKSQSQKNYTTPDFFRSLAIVRGVQANTEFAECYESLRIFL